MGGHCKVTDVQKIFFFCISFDIQKTLSFSCFWRFKFSRTAKNPPKENDGMNPFPKNEVFGIKNVLFTKRQYFVEVSPCHSRSQMSDQSLAKVRVFTVHFCQTGLTFKSEMKNALVHELKKRIFHSETSVFSFTKQIKENLDCRNT